MSEEKLPETLEELCDYIIKHSDTIYVRERPSVYAKYQSVSLKDLPGDLAVKWALNFIKRGQLPHRLIET